MNLHDELQARGFLYQFTDEKLFDIYNNGGETFYFGCDPTADSLHLGNFVVFMNAVNYMKRGNKLILIVGGATGMIGDPGGKDAERSFLGEEALAGNIAAITTQVGGILSHLTKLSGATFDFEVINNADFYRDMSYLGFLREVGKYMTINQMMNKETVKKRIEDPDKSISYTEFSYMLLQGYDFVRLFQDKNCRLQISGSDQWGNIVTGVELVKKKLDQEAYGMTGPLILDSNGKKFGKSEGNALWLDPTKTTPFDIYQYFMNTTDADIERFLKLFTLLDLDSIDTIVKTHMTKPEDRHGQRQLAKYVTTTLHGEAAAAMAEMVTEFVYGKGNKWQLMTQHDNKMKEAIMQELHGWKIIVIKNNPTIIQIITSTGLCSSNGEAKKAIEAWSIYMNEVKIEKDFHINWDTDFIKDALFIKKWKNGQGKYCIKFGTEGKFPEEKIHYVSWQL